MSLMDFLQNRPSAMDRYSQVMGLLSFMEPEPQYSSPGSTTSSSASVGSYYADTEADQEGKLVPGPAGSQRHMPGDFVMRGQGTPAPVPGETQEPYLVWDRPFGGEVPNLVTKQGITLQRGPMRSLVDIARASQILPGIQEIGEITGGWRSHETQQNMQSNPYAADPGMSFHEQGLAIDAGWWSARQRLARALEQAGWNLPMPGYEDWHWSYGVSG